MKTDCTRCGSCCSEYPIDVMYSDIVRWNNTNRRDILKQVSFVNNYPTTGHGGFYIEKTLRDPKIPCPFLNGVCKIYDTRPRVCKDYPDSHISPSCPVFKRSKNRNRLIKKQKKDMQKCVDNYKHLMGILFEARA